MAARRGAVGASDAQLISIVQTQCTGFGIPAGRISVTVLSEGGVIQPPGTRTAGCEVNVRVSHDLRFLMPVQAVFRGIGATSVQSESQFLIE